MPASAGSVCSYSVSMCEREPWILVYGKVGTEAYYPAASSLPISVAFFSSHVPDVPGPPLVHLG